MDLLFAASSILLLSALWAKYRSERGLIEEPDYEPLPEIPEIEEEPEPINHEEIAALASHWDWTCEKQPSPTLWYRLSGSSGGTDWQLVQGIPAAKGDRRDRGLKWSTNQIKAKHTWMEVFPKHVYARMKLNALDPQARNTRCRPDDPLRFIHETPPTLFELPMLNNKFVLVTVIPSLMPRLFTREAELALLALETDAVRISLGAPNLRASVHWPNPNAESIRQLADLGTLLARNYKRVVDSVF